MAKSVKTKTFPQPKIQRQTKLDNLAAQAEMLEARVRVAELKVRLKKAQADLT